MTEGLRKEWKEAKIGPEALLRARNRAWARRGTAHAAVVRLRAWQLAAVLSAAAILLVWLSPGNGPDRGRVEPGIEPRPVPEQSSSAHPPEAVPPASEVKRGAPKVHTRKPERPAPVTRKRQRPPAAAEALQAVNRPRRVELNFTLPETGVHMIWILDSEYEDGGTR